MTAWRVLGARRLVRASRWVGAWILGLLSAAATGQETAAQTGAVAVPPVGAVSAETREPSPLPAALQAELLTLQREEELVGTVAATLVDGQIRVASLGHAHGPRGVPMQPLSRLQVGSVAKTFTTLGLLRLVSQGRVALDAEVTALLPGVPIDNPWAATAPLRLRHLLDMNGGLADVRLWHLFDTRHRGDAPLAQAWRRDPAVLRLRTPPGRQFSYSNLSHTLAAAVLEAVTGERYESWMARELLAPLGLHDSGFAFVPLDEAAPAMQAWGHVDDGSAIAAVPLAVRPAAQFTTTASDLMRLAAFLLAAEGRTGNDASDPPFIRPDLLAGLGMLPSSEAAAGRGLASGYGLGLFTRDRHGTLARCHGGSVAGFRALWCLDPATRSAYAMLHNSDRESARYSRFEALMVRHLGWHTPPQPAQRADDAVTRWNGRYVPAPSRFPFMTLTDHLIGGWTLDVTPDGGTWTPDLGPARRLVPQGGHRFRQDDRVQTSLVLLDGPAGDAEVAGQGLTLRRLPAATGWGLRALALAGVLGWLTMVAWPVVTACRRGLAPAARALGEPGVVGAWALLLAAAGLALQPWTRLGEPTPVNLVLATATAAWPVLLLWQAWRDRPGVRPGAGPRGRQGAAVLGLAGCGLLAAYGLVPLRLWVV